MTLKTFAPINTIKPVEHLGPSFLPAHPKYEEVEQVIPFGHYAWLLRRHWWKIALAAFATATLAAVLASRITPIYESTARVAIDLKTPSTVIGESSITGSSGSEADQFFNTELQLIQSDAVLRPVAQQFHMMNTKAPRRMPSGMKLSDAPIYLGNLSVTHPANSFLINITYRSVDPIQAAAIANAVAHSYILRQMEMRVHSSMEESAFIEKQIAELKKNMDDSSTALSGYEKQLGVINPDEKTSILAARLMQLNTEYTESQNDRIRKEADYRAFQSGSLAAIQVSPQASALSKMEETLRAAQQKMETIKTIYGSNNTEYKRAANELNEINREYNTMQAEIGKRIEVEYQEAINRERLLHTSLMQTKSESDALNAHSMEYQELKREAEANKSLYSELFRKVKEAGINGAFQGSAIRIADEARPQLSPTFPSKTIFIAIGLIFSVGVSLLVILLNDMFDKSLRDPDQARRLVGLEVLGILPHVKRFESLSSIHPLNNLENSIRKVSNNWFETADFYEEAIDTLLSSILINRRSGPLRSILVTSSTPGEGKSSCIAHLALAHARQGYRTLLIDADLRCPSQQSLFNLRLDMGLADAMLGNRSLTEIRQKVDTNENLHVITAGNAGGRIFDRISKTVEHLLVEARSEYDLVFIDAPPMLCFAEPIQLACISDGVLIVNLAGATSRDAVFSLLATIRRIHAKPLGLVLNQVKYNMSSSYESYQSYYRHYDDTALKSA